MNEAIKLAIEQGGLKFQWDAFSQTVYFWNPGDMNKAEVEMIVYRSAFWQALGKALGWGGDGSLRSSDLEDYWIPISGPKYFAHKYFDLILTGGDTEKFWSDLCGEE